MNSSKAQSSLRGKGYREMPVRALRITSAGASLLLGLAVLAVALVLAGQQDAKASELRPNLIRSSQSGPTAPAAAVISVDLCATSGSITMPDATAIPIWGFAPGDCTGSPVAQVPGPTIDVSEGDVVTVNLYNNLSENVSIVFPGQSLVPDSVGATPGGGTSYVFTASAPATQLYESGTNASVQVPMGLYGALIVRPTTAGQAYNDPATAYDSEAVLVLSEIDPALNQSADPNTFYFPDYAPKYWLINGEAYPDTDLISVDAGDRLLVRYLNAGLVQHTMEVLGFHQTVVAGGYPLSFPYEVVSLTVASGQTYDLIGTVPAGTPAGTKYPLFSANQHVTNGAAFPGGMLTFVDTSPAPPGPDTTGPVTSGVSASPNPTGGATSVTLTATATDPPNGADPPSNIAAAEWFDGADPGVGLATPMAATDSSFDSSSEGLTAAIDVTGWTVGNHTLSVRALDAAGNWGAVANAVLDVQSDGLLFSDGFESGNVSAWSAASGAGTRITVTGAAALQGAFGMRALITGNTPAYVRDDTPANETSYHARFYFHPNATVENGHQIFVGRNTVGTTIFRIEYRRTNAGVLQIRARVQRSGGQSSTGWYTITNAAHAIEIDWQSAASASFRLYIDGVLKQTLSGLNTSAYLLDSVRLGPSGGLGGGSSGTEYFDSFVSNRNAYIGP